MSKSVGGKKMSYFGCIYFNEVNILLAKVRFEEITFLGATGYNVYVPKGIEAMREKDWWKLEDQLEDYGIEYVIMEGEENPFENIVRIDGREVSNYFSYCLLQYIYKYKLIPVDKLYAHVGIIAGRVNETLEVAASIINDVTDLTFFMNEPFVYKEVLREIYQATRLKAKAKVPCSTHLQQMDILFDMAGDYNYAKWCKPTAIYIDFKNYIGKKDVTFKGAPPSIWHDFDIICERQLCDSKMIQAAFYAQGIFKKDYLTEFKRKNVRVDTIYSTRIS